MYSNQGLTFSIISNANHPDLIKLRKTYLDSFPVNERRDFDLFLDLLINEPRFKVYILYRDCLYVGFITCWEFDSFVYVEHFAIDISFRNCGIGGILFKQFLALYQMPVVLEVELPVDDLTMRRVRFYQRLGLVLDEHDYLQPPYHSGESWTPLRLMSFGEINLSKHYELVRDTIYSHAYKVNI